MRVLVTGGSGFIGGWTAKAISDAGHEVRFLARSPELLYSSTAPLGVDVSDHVMGDVTNREVVRRAVTGCDAVVHAAAAVSMFPPFAQKTMFANLEGAHNVLGQAAELGLDPIVQVSSITALFAPGLDHYSADLPVGSSDDDGYGLSNAPVELYARELQEAGAPVAITYPGMVLGPPVGERFGEAAEGVRGTLRARWITGRDAGWLVVDVRDLAALHAALLEPGHGPRRYTAGGHRLSVPEVARLLTEVSGTDIYSVPLPDSFLRTAGGVLDRIGRILPVNPAFSEAGMTYYTQMPESDDSPSERELGIVYRDPRETLADTVTALRGGRSR